MSLIEHIEKNYLSAYKSKDQIHLNVLRLLKTAIKHLQVELKRPITDSELLNLIQRQVKQRQDAIEQFYAAGRLDHVSKESAELDILKTYLPEQLTSEELEQVVDNTLNFLGVTKMSDMGRVIQHILSQYNGKVSGKMVSEVVKVKLQARFQ